MEGSEMERACGEIRDVESRDVVQDCNGTTASR